MCFFLICQYLYLQSINLNYFLIGPEVNMVDSSDKKMFILVPGEQYAAKIVNL